jgi:septal ring factor EnvC (AmiA/AmiB activator)
MAKKRKKYITQKKARIKIGSSIPRYIGIAFLSLLLGAGLTYHYFDAGNVTQVLFKIAELEIQVNSYENQISELELQLQMNAVGSDKLKSDLKQVKEENNALKEEILFYEKIVGKRSR